MPRCSLVVGLICLAGPVGAQDLMLFDSQSFGQTVLSRSESAFDDVRLEAQVGDYNNEFIANYGPNSIFARTGRAVGRLDILTNVGHAPCTAFLISDNRLLTNHHCVPGILDNPRMQAQGATDIVAVQFKAGYTRDGIEEGVQTFHVNPVPLEMSKDLDYSVLQVIGDANARFGALALADAIPGDRDPFWVIGHPMGEAQRISREKCQADSPAVASGRLRHTCDTLPGNSGSPVIDAGLQQVVALHHAGSRAGAVNFAVPMADILAQSEVLVASAGTGAELDALERERQRLASELAALRTERDRLASESQVPAPKKGDTDPRPGEREADAASLVPASPMGARSPAGHLVFSGPPPVVPPARPTTLRTADWGRLTNQNEREEMALIVLQRHLQSWSMENALALKRAEKAYADQVFYEGRLLTRRKLLEAKEDYIARWPSRTYAPMLGKPSIDCSGDTCLVSSGFQWRVSNSNTPRSVHGRGWVELGINIATGLIVSEKSKSQK